MPREITLFTDDGQWAAVATAWDARYLIYRSLGVRVRVYRLSVPDTWGSARGPWGRLGPWLRGPWAASGPWGAAGPWRADGPWGGRGPWSRGPWHERAGAASGGPWGMIVPRSWVETPADSVEIRTRYLGPGGRGEMVREMRDQRVAFLRLEESGFGFALERRDAAEKPVRIESLRSAVRVVVAGVSLEGQVTTERDEPGGASRA